MAEDMPIEIRLKELLKQSMREKDARTTTTVRMLKTKHMEKRTAPGFSGELGDALWLEVIAAYQKQLKKSRADFANAGERGAEALEQIDWEIAFCDQFLPKMAGPDEVRPVVQEALARLGISDPKQAGRVMGDIMKTKKGVFDPQMVKTIVAEELAKS